jgi:hypothetical protein
VERANWVVLYQLLDLEKESCKNRIFTLSCLFQKFSAVYDFEKHCTVLTGQLGFVTGRDILRQQHTLYTHARTHTRIHSFIHYVVCLVTGPHPLPRVLPDSAIYCYLFQIPVSDIFRKVIRKLLTTSSSPPVSTILPSIFPIITVSEGSSYATCDQSSQSSFLLL